MYKYRISVIVPIYNVEEYMKECLDSILEQTISKDDIEVLLIVDGSPDNSEQICREYAAKYPFFKVFTKENEGLSRTRNYGLKRAQGKYLVYLDPDDKLTPESLKNLADFFDKHEDEVDIITYKIIPVFEGKQSAKLHYRYKFLEEEGIYDLTKPEGFYISQTNVNVCVKNEFENNILFDTTENFRHEDQKYNIEIVRRKMKIGYCTGAQYLYTRNPTSITSTAFYAYYIFETTTAFWENLFAEYPDKVPEYIQAMYVNDLNWKLNADILYPYHYEKDKFDEAMERLSALLRRVDIDTIINHPSVDIFRACYWIEFRKGSDIELQHNDDGLSIVVDGKEIYKQEDFVIIAHKPRVEGDTFRLTGFAKSSVFNFLKDDDYEIYAVENGKRIKLDTFTSVHSHYKAKVLTNRFPAFHYECNLTENSKIQFEVKIKDKIYPSHFWYMPYAGFRKAVNTINRGKYILRNKRYCITAKPANQFKIDLSALINTIRFLIHPRVTLLRLKSIAYRKKHRIWLYYDFYSVEKDNGYFQFANDLKHDDGIERYYVLTHEYENLDDVFTPEQQKHLVKFGSKEHRLLFICAERIFTAYYGLAPVNPFDTAKQKYQYEDLIRFRTIYLQHGVLHASLRLNNSEERSQAEEIVVSSPFEVKNYIQNYAYKEENLITTGMARYDHIDRTHQAKNRILFAPSWRKYLTNEVKSSNWEANTEKIQKSDYYKNFYLFLSDKRLHKSLEEHNVYLDIKLHPIIASLTDLFDIDCEYINMVSGDVDVADYNAFVTDFSSYVFDFAYLERPIMYFVPDYPQFKSGMNHYRELDLPFEDAFGHMFTEPDKAAECLCSIIENKFVPEEIYAKRMAEFYFKFDGNCAENLYQFVVEQDKKLNI